MREVLEDRCGYIYICVCVCVCVGGVCVCIYVHRHARMCASVYVRMYVCALAW